MIYATVICDSISPLGVRLTSIEIQFPRFILSQLLMHRMWSRSCESLRARPTKSKVAEVEADPVVPVFAKNQRGMVAGAELEAAEQAIAKGVWGEAHRAAVKAAKELAELGVAKQWANRLLEPFAYQKMLVTATDFANFFRLRCADDAQPEIAELAVKMREAMAASEPVQRSGECGHWHRPYIDAMTLRQVKDDRTIDRLVMGDAVLRISAARCARVSYGDPRRPRDIQDDLRLTQTLIDSGHSNPFEHQATPAPDDRRYGNMRGWVSYRYRMEQDGRLPNAEG